MGGSESTVPRAMREAALDLRNRLERRFGARLVDVRLFGSCARGDWGPESDIDVLVVISELTHRERCEVFDLAQDVFFERLVHVSPFALSTDEWRTLQDREYLIASDIAREGIPL